MYVSDNTKTELYIVTKMKTLQQLVVLSFIIGLAGGELVVSDVDDPILTVDVAQVSGYRGRLPCNITSAHYNDPVSMILWYRESTNRQPIFSLDARSVSLNKGTGASNWSDPSVFGSRASMNVNINPAQLEIDPLEPTDAGIYRCRVDFRDSPTKNQLINLTVIVPPDKPTIYIGPERTYTNGHATINEGARLSLVCEVNGGSPPPRLIWYLGEQKLDDTSQREQTDITVNVLDIPMINRTYATTKLSCRAFNTHLIRPNSTDILLNVNLKPEKVNITNKQNHLSALQTYEIECVTAGSRPEAIITWWKGSHQVKHMAKKINVPPDMTGSVLSYVATIEDDKKFLMCRAENPIVPNSALEDRWMLVVHYVPVVTIRLGSGLRANDINEGDDVYFECDVKANPDVYKLNWFKDGKELHQNVTAGIRLPGEKSLVLQNVNRASAGEYACMAVNAEGSSVSRPVTLEVMYAPICKDGSLIQIVGALKHETISLVCGVQAKPPPTMFHWTFNNSGELSMPVPADRYGPIKPQTRITNQWHGSRLNYTIEQDSDYGTVSCWAENRRGVQRTPCLFQIIVAGRPYPLQNCTAVQSTGPYGYRTNLVEEPKPSDTNDAEWLIVRCNESFDGGLPLTGFELEVYSEENAYHINTIYFNRTERLSSHHNNHHHGPIFEVPGLEPGRNYKLLVYAVNAKGRSDPAVLSSITLKGVAMYTTGKGSSEEGVDLSLLMACFAGGITAVCILVFGIIVTLYRRNNTTRPMKSHLPVIHSVTKDDPGTQQQQQSSAIEQQRVIKEPATRFKDNQVEPLLIDNNDDNPDVIPSKLSGNDYSIKTVKAFSNVDSNDYPSPATVLHGQEPWIYTDGYSDRRDPTSPLRPNNLPVHRTHDVYTKSSRVQESCI